MQHAPKKNSVLSSVYISTEGVKRIEIHRPMKDQYGDACLSLLQVYQWTGQSMNAISSVTDCPRPSQAHPVVTPEGIAAVEGIVWENLHVTANDVARTSGRESRICTPFSSMMFCSSIKYPVNYGMKNI